MRRFLLIVFLGIELSGYSLVYDLSLLTNGSNVFVQWKGPESFEGSLYYNVYRSFSKPLIKESKIFNFSDFEFLGTLYYSTNKEFMTVQDNLTNTNVFYLILPVSNGFFVYDNVELNIVPPITKNTNLAKDSNLLLATNLVSKDSYNANQSNGVTSTNVSNNISNWVSTNVVSTNFVFATNNIEIEKDKITKLSNQESAEDDIAILSYSTALPKIVKDYFMKGNYKVTLKKLYILREEAETLEEREIVDIYIARCYYALNKKRKSIYILLNIKSENVKPIAEFWLNRFSRYFFGNF